MDRDDLTYELTESPFRDGINQMHYEEKKGGNPNRFAKQRSILGVEEINRMQKGYAEFLPRLVTNMQERQDMQLMQFVKA